MTHSTLVSKSHRSTPSSPLALLRELFMATPAFIFIAAAKKALATKRAR